MFNYYVPVNDCAIDTSSYLPHLLGLFVESGIFLIGTYIRWLESSRTEKHCSSVKIQTIEPHLTYAQCCYAICGGTFMMLEEITSATCVIPMTSNFSAMVRSSSE